MPLLEKLPTSLERRPASPASQISMRSEWQRKMIHLCSISIPIMYIWLPRSTMLWIFVPLAIVGIIVEILRKRVPAVETFIRKYFGSMLRSHESSGGKAKISGATYVILSAALCALIFPKVVTIAGFAVLIVSDTASALYGRRFGRHRFLEKSVEGSSAFVVTAILVVLGVASIYHAPLSFILIGILASVVAAIAEAMSYGVNIDDNLTIPLSFGAVMWGGMAMVGGEELVRLLGVG